MISGFGDKYRIAIRMCSNSHKKKQQNKQQTSKQQTNKQQTNKQQTNKAKTMQIIR
jgi:hypothetical protein